MDFNKNTPEFDKVIKVIVGSKQGMIFIVNYTSRCLESVFKIHDSSINTLTIKGGFCVTGSQDHYLRVWPLDFSEFYLEAKHDGILISSDISFDGLKVAVGTTNSYLGIMDLETHSCKTLMRAHYGEIFQLHLT